MVSDETLFVDMRSKGDCQFFLAIFITRIISACPLVDTSPRIHRSLYIYIQSLPLTIYSHPLSLQQQP